jgi:hypothetical protein
VKPTMDWKDSPHVSRAKTLIADGKRYTVKPEGPGSHTYRLWIDGHRTDKYGVGPHYVMVIAENIINMERVL